MARSSAAILGASTSGIENTASDRLIQLQVHFSGHEYYQYFSPSMHVYSNRTTFYAESVFHSSVKSHSDGLSKSMENCTQQLAADFVYAVRGQNCMYYKSLSYVVPE